MYASYVYVCVCVYIYIYIFEFDHFSLNLYFLSSLGWQQNWGAYTEIFHKLPAPTYT